MNLLLFHGKFPYFTANFPRFAAQKCKYLLLYRNRILSLYHQMFYLQSDDFFCLSFCDFRANELRRVDRVRNSDKYPYVDYKEIYVLAAGYKNFYGVDNDPEALLMRVGFGF